jgi:hypothetical protein
MQNRCCSQRCQPAECFAAIHHDLISVLPQPTNELKPSCASGYISIAENGKHLDSYFDSEQKLFAPSGQRRSTNGIFCCDLL